MKWVCRSARRFWSRYVKLDDVTAVERRPHAGEIDLGELRQQLLDLRLVLLADVHHRTDPVVRPEQRRQRGHRVEGAAELLQHVPAVGRDPVERDRAQHRNGHIAMS